jgi:hypothetical protein
MEHAEQEMTRNAKGERLLSNDVVKGTCEDRDIIRWRRSRNYKASAVCEMVAALEAAGV